MSEIEQKIIEFARRGDHEKVKWLKSMHRHIPESQVRKIQQNDKNVLKELVLPKWVTWDFLYSWANTKKLEKGRRCILCNNLNENGIDFMEKYICENCFLKIKNTE